MLLFVGGNAFCRLEFEGPNEGQKYMEHLCQLYKSKISKTCIRKSQDSHHSNSSYRILIFVLIFLRNIQRSPTTLFPLVLAILTLLRKTLTQYIKFNRGGRGKSVPVLANSLGCSMVVQLLLYKHIYTQILTLLCWQGSLLLIETVQCIHYPIYKVTLYNFSCAYIFISLIFLFFIWCACAVLTMFDKSEEDEETTGLPFMHKGCSSLLN